MLSFGLTNRLSDGKPPMIDDVINLTGVLITSRRPCRPRTGNTPCLPTVYRILGDLRKFLTWNFRSFRTQWGAFEEARLNSHLNAAYVDGQLLCGELSEQH